MIRDDELLGAVSRCLADPDETGLSVDGTDPERLKPGERLAVEIGTPRLGFARLRGSIDDLLRLPQDRSEEPKHYILMAPALFVSPDNDVPDDVRRYRLLLRFVALLAEAAAFLDRAGANLVFIRDGKFELPVAYNAADVRGFDDATLLALVEDFPGDTHRPQRLSILAEAVCDLVQGQPSPHRFGYLLGHLAELKRRYGDGYKTFAAGFSYEKIRSEVEAARIEFTSRIHKVFSDIQNQILAIPVAAVIAVTQMKMAESATQGWINVAVFFACCVFAAMVWILLGNQCDTLDTLGAEIERQREHLTREYEELTADIRQMFAGLVKRIDRQRLILWFLQGVALVGAFVALGFFLYMTPQVREILT